MGWATPGWVNPGPYYLLTPGELASGRRVTPLSLCR